ncbi:hypothetical protein FGO68_gene1829 [Halteria grandinella]|uniref:Uncharacterized protein n=1 Tax=Halteria grandinella TaxID=5974 RepID=A0A8J8NMG5_HALGN|nr:hypothetical protein FGO68_gene1829 [Halteria grandinella]
MTIRKVAICKQITKSALTSRQKGAFSAPRATTMMKMGPKGQIMGRNIRTPIAKRMYLKVSRILAFQSSLKAEQARFESEYPMQTTPRPTLIPVPKSFIIAKKTISITTLKNAATILIARNIAKLPPMQYSSRSAG